MKARLMFVNSLTLMRLVAGPAFLIWGHVPAHPWELLCLLTAAGSDVIDGRLARRWGATSIVGRLMDPVADRTLIGCMLLKLAAGGVLPYWLVGAVLLQHVLLVATFVAYKLVTHVAPPSDFWARAGSVTAIVAATVGLVTLSGLATIVLLVVFVFANMMYVCVVGRRTLLARRGHSVSALTRHFG